MSSLINPACRAVYREAQRIDRIADVVDQPHVPHAFRWIMCQRFIIDGGMDDPPGIIRHWLFSRSGRCHRAGLKWIRHSAMRCAWMTWAVRRSAAPRDLMILGSRFHDGLEHFFQPSADEELRHHHLPQDVS